MTKPTSVPTFATSLTNRTAIPIGLSVDGFSVDTELPAQYFNQLIGIHGDWLDWLKKRIQATALVWSITEDGGVTLIPVALGKGTADTHALNGLAISFITGIETYPVPYLDQIEPCRLKLSAYARSILCRERKVNRVTSVPQCRI